MSTIDWPEAPPFDDVRRAYFDRERGCLPKIGNIQPRRYPGAAPSVQFTVTGYWIYLVPPLLWSVTPSPVRTAISALYKAGYRSIPAIACAPAADLLHVENIGEYRLGLLYQWLRERRIRVGPTTAERVEPRQVVRDQLRPGAKLRFYFGEGNPNNGVQHVRAIVDSDYIVVRLWSREEQRWIYAVNDIDLFVRFYKDGQMTVE